MTPSVTWPFVGRQDLVDAVIAHLADDQCGGVLLAGEAGIGKTRLADAVLASVRATGSPVLRAVASSAARTTPFGAIAHAIPIDAVATTGPTDPMRIFMALRGEHGSDTRRRTVMMIDDIPFLDDATVTLISQLLSAGLLFVVATARTGTTIPPSTDSIVRAFGFRRVELDDLTPQDVERTMSLVLGGPVEPSSATTLWNVTEGNALYVRELLLGAIEAGAVERPPGGTFRLADEAWSSRRMIEFVGERLESIAKSRAGTLALIAVAEPLLLSDLEREGLVDDAAELERLGVVEVDTSGHEPMIRLSHPLHGEVMRTRLGTLDRRRHVMRAIEIVTARPAARPDDPLRIATWRLDVGQSAEPTVLLAGARLARASLDYPSTARLARAVYEVEPSATAQHLLAEALFLLGEATESERVASLPSPADIDPFTAMLLVAARVNNLLWGVNDPDQALEVVAGQRSTFAAIGLEDMLTIIEANVHAFDGRPALALEILEPLDQSVSNILLGATPFATAMMLQGHVDRAIAYAQQARAAHMALEHPKTLLDPNTHLLTQGTALLVLGGLAEAERMATDAHAEAIIDRTTFMRCWQAIVVGKALLAQGSLGRARNWFTDALAAAEEINLRPGRRMALAGLAAAAGQQGDAMACAPLLADLDAVPPDLRYFLGDAAIGKAWALVALGRPAEARAVLRQSLDEAVANGDLIRAIEVATESARLGDADGVRRPAEAAAARIDGPFAQARLRLIVARCTDDPEDLRLAEDALAAVGANLLAAEAASALANRRRRDGLLRESSAAAARAHTFGLQCPGATTPGLLIADSVTPLSSREAEIAQLAGRGLASKEIADRLFLSVRTVSNHLQNIYTKLGVASRAELTEALATTTITTTG